MEFEFAKGDRVIFTSDFERYDAGTKCRVIKLDDKWDKPRYHVLMEDERVLTNVPEEDLFAPDKD